MFRSMSNFKGMTFDEDEDDPGSCISNAAMGFHNEETSPFFTTSIQHDNKDKFKFRISPYGSNDNLVDDKVQKGNGDHNNTHNATNKKQTPKTITAPSKYDTGSKQSETSSQGLNASRNLGPRKSPVRRLGRGISLDNYHDGEYFRDNFGNIYVHKLFPRAASVGYTSDVGPPVDTKTFNSLKSSFNKWRRNIKSRNSLPKLEADKEKAAVFSLSTKHADFRTNRSQQNSKLEGRHKSIKGDFEAIQECKYEQNQKSDISPTETTGKSKVLTKDHRNKSETRNKKVKSVEKEQGRLQSEESYQLQGRSKDEDKGSSYLRRYGRVASLDSTSSQTDNATGDSAKQRRQYFSSPSFHYYTVIKDETKKYVSSVSWKLK